MKKYVAGFRSFLLQLGARQANVLMVSMMAFSLFSLSLSIKEKKHKTAGYSQGQWHTDVFAISLQDVKGLKNWMVYKLGHFMENWFFSDLAPKPNYLFQEVFRPFGQVSLYRSSEISGEEFETLILQSVPKIYQQKLKLYVRKTMHLATEYQVDPFWIISIMWVESHFENNARSPMDARGLMQIMPGTGKFIAQKLNLDLEEGSIYDLMWSPGTNIEMGIFYLRYLLDYFDNDYILATMAYNHGPARVKQLIDEQNEVISTNQYFKKVKKAYRRLTREYIKTVENASRPVLVTMDKNLNN
ncbi:MAG: hypothetical protein A2381_11055 [Bdellovibrionales bacterium RIFOXYB1_FULL_37_110]|nr:MAG: hypothetical protein A2181_01375 [Bdellovibrionales bacterium RIFOXYA1_FULL_38_20]OFZ48578.1 MAG: hypothetical protein A2417_09540 [Bdellovibrionales bacterium RIFOXYC1_FULL_37_79]OFZ58387.1 MAG: hypothetical protein A2381_11055 [Bdellovibrionales bacterium RIFOXYB1_FULL_37_110]OFZ62524.1 MAG: hypothetical protein A2577_01275 [Bdellovibrionales bacterium RIFOXYD1_FULL_36_51]